MELLTPDIGLVAWATISFILLLIVLKKFAWKPIVTTLDERNTSIENALAQAEAAREEMKALSARNEEILKEAKEERNNILKEANKVKEQIVADAKLTAQENVSKIMEDASKDIENQKLAVMAELKNASAGLALEIAEKVIAKQLSAKGEQEKFISELAAQANLN